MRRVLPWLLPVLAAGALVLGWLRDSHTRPREALEEALRAASRGDRAGYVEHFVSAAQVGALVECADDAHPWLMPARRQELLDAIEVSLDRPARHMPVTVNDFEVEDRDDPYFWNDYDEGETIYGSCRARRSFGKVTYRAELGFADGTTHSLPISFWVIDGDAHLWKDPLD